MSLRLFRTDDPSERETEALLAWYVNGTLDTSEHARVERHLTECLRCRREVQRLREFQAGMMQEVSVPALERALAGAHARLDEFEQRWRPAALVRRLGKSWRAAPSVVRGALAVQLVLIIGLGVALTLPREPPAPYRTLSAPAVTTHGAATIFVVFDGATQEAELRALLTGVGARIVGGPSAAGVYTVDVASGLESEVIAQLRASPAVRFAERASSSTR